LNTNNFIALAILTHGGGGGGIGEGGGEDSETSGGGGGGGICGIIYLIKLIALLSETFVSSSSSPHRGEMKGLVSSSALPLFL